MIGSSSNKAHSRVRPLCVLSVMLLIQAAAVSVFAQDNVQHEYVDLGLSVKWATCNVGASKPEEAGCHYAWGELEEKDNYIVENYKFYDSDDYYRINKYNSNSLDGKDGFTDDKMILDPEDDVAHEKWGGKWRMPTAEEWEELKNNTTSTWTTQNDVYGRLFTSENGNSIFLPATHTFLYGQYWGGGYWSSSLFWHPDCGNRLSFGSGAVGTGGEPRYAGLSVRPVRSL